VAEGENDVVAHHPRPSKIGEVRSINFDVANKTDRKSSRL
jgi:hypothetical protein